MQHNSALQKNHDLLLDYLRNHYHANLADTLAFDSLELLQGCFHEFSVFLADLAPVSAWWETFLIYAYELIEWLHRPNWHVAWVVRSGEFTEYALGLDLPIHPLSTDSK